MNQKFTFAPIAAYNRAAYRLAGTGVGVTTCIGFPLGACSTQAKAAEAAQAVAALFGTTARQTRRWENET